MRLLLGGIGNDDIANILNISPKTVCNCHYLINCELSVNTNIEQTRLAIKLNVLDLLELSGHAGLNSPGN
ncbi:MAG: hypothetical protein Q8Q40_05635 [Methylococcaceae bacterium]|nr:hypothetical protein [Methylococcaceae bacterium]MDP3903437.1 hypothetical protein [Methylococcaceae bacterium]